MQHHDQAECESPLSALIGTIVSDFNQRHELAEVTALHARLAEVCGHDTVLNIVCDHTGFQLHVTTFGEGCRPH